MGCNDKGTEEGKGDKRGGLRCTKLVNSGNNGGDGKGEGEEETRMR